MPKSPLLQAFENVKMAAQKAWQALAKSPFTSRTLPPPPALNYSINAILDPWSADNGPEVPPPPLLIMECKVGPRDGKYAGVIRVAIDTGAMATVLFKDAAQRLNLALRPAESSITGVGGTMKAWQTKTHMDLPHLRTGFHSYVIDRAEGPTSDPHRIDMLLGLPALRQGKFKVDLDSSRADLVLMQDESGKIVPYPVELVPRGDDYDRLKAFSVTTFPTAHKAPTICWTRPEQVYGILDRLPDCQVLHLTSTPFQVPPDPNNPTVAAVEDYWQQLEKDHERMWKELTAPPDQEVADALDRMEDALPMVTDDEPSLDELIKQMPEVAA